ncbi:MAG: hypothetical protein H6725_12725 [Sandaracinaceae bacterium]|nr:hypothetical protein [Sandaracinaceae bacterium]
MSRSFVGGVRSTRAHLGLFGLALACVASLPSCGGDSSPGLDTSRPPRVSLTGSIPQRLSEYNLLAYDGDGQFRYNDRVVPYDLNTPLFTDYALKDRAIYVPDGSSATYTDEGVFDFPVGSVLIKSFSVAADLRTPDVDVTLVETRLLIRYEDGWRAFPYVWDAAQREAIYSPAGEVRAVPFIDADGVSQVANYLIPQRNQCLSCHERRVDGVTLTMPIGPKARNLNRDYDYGVDGGVQNQLTRLAAEGLLSGLPSLAEVDAAYAFAGIEANGVGSLTGAELDDAARSYLDVNCAHCHNPNGVQGVTSQLFLNYDNTDDFRLGLCKRPGSAGSGTGGFTFDILPGNPDESILIFRVETEEVGAMMPLLGRSLQHRHGAELLRAWVAEMPANDCSAAP